MSLEHVTCSIKLLNLTLFTIFLSVQDIVFQLQRLVAAMAHYHNESHVVLRGADVFPIEVDLSRSTFTYDTSGQFQDDEEEYDDEEAEPGQEVIEDNLISTD